VRCWRHARLCAIGVSARAQHARLVHLTVDLCSGRVLLVPQTSSSDGTSRGDSHDQRRVRDVLINRSY
jgi:hypothetical protein